MSQAHEQWFHFTKEPKYFAAVDEVREPGKSGWEQNRVALTDHEAEDGFARRFHLRTRDEPNPLGKLPGSVWNLTYWECVDRIERGWAPQAICMECGEGRRPVVDKTLHEVHGRVVAGRGDTQIHDSTTGAGTGWQHGGGVYGRHEATITGYACACPEPTSETRPPVILLEPPPLSVMGPAPIPGGGHPRPVPR